MINSPPQHGKSLAVDDFVAWVAGMNPSMRVIFASYSDELGVRANKEVERVMSLVEYRKMFPNTQIDLPGWQMNSGLIEYCGHRGYFRNVTVRGGVTGMALDIGIIDDPIKGRREAHSPTERNAVWGWLTDDFRSRFSKRAGMLMINCPVGDTPVSMADGLWKPIRDVGQGWNHGRVAAKRSKSAHGV